MVESAFTNPLSSFFFPQNDKNVPQGLRQKIALAMLMQKRAYPKTFGEGLASIGSVAQVCLQSWGWKSTIPARLQAALKAVLMRVPAEVSLAFLGRL